MYTFWLTGLPSSGKTTLGGLLKTCLEKNSISAEFIDGDEVRKTICKDLGFSDKDRKENIRRVATLAKNYNESGKHAICCFVSPTTEIREIARTIIGIENFYEIYVDAPLSICEKRDIKGLYEKARLGLIPDFTGIGSPYEIPQNPDLQIKTHTLTVGESSQLLIEAVLKRISKTE
ncbi:MAG: adenylyl-sulfate kinase [Tenuifilaceae bacterium]